jgi:hypothetical protein
VANGAELGWGGGGERGVLFMNIVIFQVYHPPSTFSPPPLTFPNLQMILRIAQTLIQH